MTEPTYPFQATVPEWLFRAFKARASAHGMSIKIAAAQALAEWLATHPAKPEGGK